MYVVFFLSLCACVMCMYMYACFYECGDPRLMPGVFLIMTHLSHCSRSLITQLAAQISLPPTLESGITGDRDSHSVFLGSEDLILL